MTMTRGVTRRTILTGATGILAAPAIIGRAYAATRGVTDSQITFGTMQDLSGVTAVQGVNNADAMRMVYEAVNAKGGIHGRKLNWVLEDKQELIDIVETIYKGARKGRGLVISPKDYSTRYRY